MKFEVYMKVFLAILLVGSGLNKFLPLIAPMELAPKALEFMNSIAKTGYLLELVGGIEVLCGAMLMKRSATPLALILLAPISVNIFCFHLFLDISSIWPALLVTTCNLFLLYKNRDFYSPVLFSLTNGKSITKEKLENSNLSYR